MVLHGFLRAISQIDHLNQSQCLQTGSSFSSLWCFVLLVRSVNCFLKTAVYWKTDTWRWWVACLRSDITPMNPLRKVGLMSWQNCEINRFYAWKPIFSGPFCAYHILGKRKWWNGFDNIWRECTGATWKNCERQRYSWSPSLFSPRPNVPSVRTLAVPPQVRCEVVVLRPNVILWSVAISTEFLSHCSAWCQSSCITCKEVQNQFDVLKSGNKLSPTSWVDLIKISKASSDPDFKINSAG